MIFRRLKMGIYIIGISILCFCAAADTCVDISTLQEKHDFGFGEAGFVLNEDFDFTFYDVWQYGLRFHPDICPGGVEGLIKATRLFPDKYVINLKVSDFYKFNYNYVKQHLAYGGDRNTSQHEVEACVVDLKKKDDDLLNITCNKIKTTSYPEVKLMSRNVENNVRLLNFITNYPNNAPLIEKTILVCYKHVINKKFGFNIAYSEDCENDIKKYQNNLLAVLAPKPFETDHHTLAPTVLYQAPCYDKYTTHNENYMTVITCEHYKYALLEFLKHSKWTRVAIVSDNTPYSENFEREMTDLLEENGFAYTVARCIETTTKRCSFVEALQSLKNSDARVFIANVNKMYALNIRKQIRNVWKEKNIKSSWILRDFMLTGDTEAMGDIYSISLAPSTSNENPWNGIKLNGNLIQYKSSIIEAIIRIKQAYEKIKLKHGDEEGSSFFRALAKEIQRSLWSSQSRVTAYVNKKGTSQYIVKMIVDDSKISLSSIDYSPRPDMDGNCAMRSRNFHDPCNDNRLLTIMVLLVVVAGCGLLAVIYTSSLDKDRRQYSNLS